MRVKTEQLVITFATTSAAMAMEQYCTEHNLPGRLIPLPGEISAGCGLAWKTDPALEQELKDTLCRAGLKWEWMTVIRI